MGVVVDWRQICSHPPNGVRKGGRTSRNELSATLLIKQAKVKEEKKAPALQSEHMRHMRVVKTPRKFRSPERNFKKPEWLSGPGAMANGNGRLQLSGR